MAGPTRAAGHPNYASSGTIGFIPELWSSTLAPKFYAETVGSIIANTNWEGEIKKQGDSVKIRVTPSLDINDYEVGGGIIYQKPSSSYISLDINKAKSWGFEVNDVEEYQSDINLMSDWSADAAKQMKIAVDRNLLGYEGNGFAGASDANVASTNIGTTAGALSAAFDLGTSASPEALTAATILDYIVDLSTVLTETNIPEEGRWLLLPAWACGLIQKSDLKDASLAGDSKSILRSDVIGNIAGFDIVKTNNLKQTATYTRIYAGHPKGLTFAAQITKVEELPNPNDFGRIVRGLNVFGYQVVNPDALAVGYIAKG